jgi:hypothetical protein
MPAIPEAKGAAFFHVGEGPLATTPGATGQATGAPTSTPAPAGEDDSDGVPMIALIGGIIGGLVVGGGGGLLLGRRR